MTHSKLVEDFLVKTKDQKQKEIRERNNLRLEKIRDFHRNEMPKYIDLLVDFGFPLEMQRELGMTVALDPYQCIILSFSYLESESSCHFSLDRDMSWEQHLEEFSKQKEWVQNWVSKRIAAIDREHQKENLGWYANNIAIHERKAGFLLFLVTSLLLLFCFANNSKPNLGATFASFGISAVLIHRPKKIDEFYDINP